MRHNSGLKKLNRTSSHRKAMLSNMAASLIKHEQIRTTLAKAKVLRPFVEKIITMSKTKDLSTVRRLRAILRDTEVITKLLDDVGPRVAKRPGGYTRIYKFGFRYGDSAPMSLIELVDKKQVVTVSGDKKNLSDKEKKDEKEVAAKKVTKKAAPLVKKDENNKKASENKKPTAKVIRRTAH